MANEIYDSTWWGNTRQTASSIGTSTEMIQGQFNLTKIGDEEVVNGDFATDSDWNKGTGWSISGGSANFSGGTDANFNQNNIIENGKKYLLEFDLINLIDGGVTVRVGNINVTDYTLSESKHYALTTISDGTSLMFRSFSNTGGFSIDNVSVKEVRATTVEASKCLADTIHRIGLQDIQN